MPKCPSTAAPRGHARLARPRRGRAAQRNKTLAPGALPAASVPPGSQVRSLGVRCRPMRPLVGPLTGLFQEAPAGGRLGAELPAAGAAPEGPIGGWHQPTHTRTHSNPCNLHCGTAETDGIEQSRIAVEKSKLRNALRTLRKARPRCVRQGTRAFDASTRLIDWRSSACRMQRETAPATAPLGRGSMQGPAFILRSPRGSRI